jgi:small subunit ribosomal protein S15
MKKLQENQKNTGDIVYQICSLTDDINSINEHLKIHSKDFSTKRGLMKKVGLRKRLLKYIHKRNPESYYNALEKANLRK